MAPTNCFPYRPHDYMYDPIFTVSGPTDHYKAAIAAKASTAKFQICPIFPNMFSDLTSHPRVQLVRRRTAPIQSYAEKSGNEYDPSLHRQPDVLGADRLKFFCPIINFPPRDSLPYMYSPTFTIERIVKNNNNTLKPTRSVHVETKYRESEAQTIPWEPPYVVKGKGDPEILKLSFLQWGSGLPAGMHEVRLIERARMKAAWEKAVKPDVNDANSLQQFRDYVEALERDEYAFREQEIQEIQDLRLELLEKMLNEIHQKTKMRTEMKINSIIAAKQKEKEEQIAKIRKKTERELRKINAQEKGFIRKYHAVNIVEEHVDKKSEIYGPLMRHGEHPKRWHKVIDEKLKKYKAQFIGVEHFSTLPKWLDQGTTAKRIHVAKTKGGLCIRETKWSAPVLKELHEELKNLRKETVKRPLSLRTRVEEPEVQSFTPEVEGIPQLEENKYQAVVLLQSILRGRTAQMMIYEGRDTCKELIKELKNSVGLLRKQKEQRTKEKLKVKAQQREETIQINMVQRLQGTLGKLQGFVVGSLLDFLNKELRRLLEERKAHAMCLLNERERCIREAAEAGRRQKELRRRREHDEIFKQVVKVTQDSVDLYLQEIITEGMEFASKDEAAEYVMKLADQIEKDTNAAYETITPLDEQDEIIADLVHHFVLPEVQKQIVRQKIVAKQKKELKTIHDAIYNQYDYLPRIESPEEVARKILRKIEDRVFKTARDPETLRPPKTEEKEPTIEPSMISEYPQDIIEKYLSQLAVEQNEYDTCDYYSHYPVIEENDDYYFMKHEELDTIPEVDSEHTSGK